MYSDVVMEKAEQKNDVQIREKLEHILENYKNKNAIKNDYELSTDDLKYLGDSSLSPSKLGISAFKNFPPSIPN